MPQGIDLILEISKTESSPFAFSFKLFNGVERYSSGGIDMIILKEAEHEVIGEHNSSTCNYHQFLGFRVKYS